MLGLPLVPYINRNMNHSPDSATLDVAWCDMLLLHFHMFYVMF